MEDLQPLNNCEIFNQIRSEFTNYHNQEKKLNTFNFFSGNEVRIKELARRINNVLLEHGLVEQEAHPKDEDKLVTKPTPGCNVDQLRGTMMYLILNSVNIKSEEDSKLDRWNPQCVHLLNQFPAPLSQLVTVSLALECGMVQQFLEFLACGPHWLTSQYFDCYNDTLSHLVSDRREILPFICGPLSAVTKSICYHKSKLNLMPNALRLVQRHLLDTEERLDLIRSKASRHRYLGEAMRALLDVLLEAIQALEVKLQLPDYFPVYALRLMKLEIKEESPENALSAFAAKLMDTVQRLLPQISVDTYMTWQDLPSGRLLFHLQAHICNQSKQLLELICRDQTLKTHSLRSYLVNFADGAQTFDQRLETLTLGELLSFLDGEMGEVSDESILAGLNQLMQRSIAFGSDECIESMTKHVKLLGLSHAHLILDHLLQVVRMSELQMEQGEQEDREDSDLMATYDELLLLVLLPIYKNCSNPQDKLELLHKRDMLQDIRFDLENSDAQRISFFNTLNYSIESFPLLKFLDLCFEQPKETWLSFAQLGMVHPRFASLYRHIAFQCASHAEHHLVNTMQHLMQDDRLLIRSTTQTQADFLLQLYELPMLLIASKNSSLDSSTIAELGVKLQFAQNSYLSSLAAGLAKFTESLNYSALERLMSTLLQLEVIEKRHISSSWKRFQSKRKRKPGLGRTQLLMAKKSAALIRKLGWWRAYNWTLTSQLIVSMDKLRGDLRNFEASRIQVLDLTMEYYVKNMPRFLTISGSLQREVDELLQTLEHKHLWKDDQLAVFLTGGRPLEAKECSLLLTQASSLEAVKLLGDAIRHKIDRDVMKELAQAVDLVNTSSSSNALRAYGFLIKCYMQAFNDVLIKPAKSSDYPCLIEHLLQTPKLLMPENLFFAVDNFKTLLNTKEHISEEKILQFANLNLTKQADN